MTALLMFFLAGGLVAFPRPAVRAVIWVLMLPRHVALWRLKLRLWWLDTFQPEGR